MRRLIVVILIAWSSLLEGQGVPPTIFEGARLITGDGSAPIENSAFIVDNGRFTRVGRRGEFSAPAGAVHVDLTGKTVMPGIVDLHGHIGFQDVPAGTMSKESFTRANLIDHLERLAYHGVTGVVGVGDLLDRSDLHGGRTNWGDVPLQVRDQVIPNAALFRTAGTGLAWPGSGAQGHPSRVDVSYPVSTVAEARAAVDDYVRIKPSFVKIWVDDRAGTKQTLTPPLYRAVIEEAHKFNVPVGVHNVTLANAKELMKAGVEGWLHVPVRGGDAVDAELVAIVKDRIARNNRPVIWMTPSLITAWMDTQGGGARPAWLDDPLLHETYSASDIEEHWGTPLKKMTAAEVARARESFALDAKNAMTLRAAGMRIVNGTDTGQSRFWIGYFNHLDLEALVAMGLTPSQAIVAATRDSAAIAGFNTGSVAPGKNGDFIVLDANPLENISNTRRINKVYLRGREVPRAAMAAKWKAQFRNASTQSQAPGDDAVKVLVSRLQLEPYKATIKGLTQFGDRAQGTERNKRAIDWIEAQLRSYGCVTERLRYVYAPPPPGPPAAPLPTGPIASGEIRRGVGGSRQRGITTARTGVGPSGAQLDAQPDPALRALNSETAPPGPREEVYCTKIGATRPGEMYIVGAHMDGRGLGEGADDNASGTALVMELARIFSNPEVQTATSIRFALWNNEEGGLFGSTSYVEQRAALQGKEDPPGSGRYPEPKWLGMIQHDMMLWDHGMPRPDGSVSPEQRLEADVNIEFQSTAKLADQASKLAFFFRDANEKYATDYPAAVGNHMTNTDSTPFMDIVPSISLRENERGMQTGAGWNPQYHQPTDLYTAYSDKDFRLGLNAAQTTLGAVAELAGATLRR